MAESSTAGSIGDKADQIRRVGWSDPSGKAAPRPAPLRLLIVSDLRLLRDALAEALARERDFQIVGCAADLAEALRLAGAVAPDMILIDTALPAGPAAAAQLRQGAPPARLVALAVEESTAEVTAWAMAGACGYVPRTAAISECAPVLRQIARGEQACSSSVAGGLLHWIANRPEPLPPGPRGLTARERQVAALIDAGLSNKEIARRLDIGLATTKSHVHNLLGKLALARRSQVARWLHERGGPPRPFRTRLGDSASLDLRP